MIHFDGPDLGVALEMRGLIDRIAAVMRGDPTILLRQRVTDAAGREMLIMPAMLGDYAGVKALTVTPANRGTPRPVISGLFTLFKLSSGEALATMDAAELTARRTSATSAAAAERLALGDASTLVVLGAGHLAPYMAAAHAAVRPIRRIRIWARDIERARIAAVRTERLIAGGATTKIEAVSDLEDAVRSGDIVSAATGATTPLIKGEWLRSGAHVDLVGGYRPDMREIDDAGIARARIFVDDRKAALREAGDLVNPIRRGVISPDAICGDLAALCAGSVGRRSDDHITLFKSVGIGIVDLVAAIQVWERRDDLARSAGMKTVDGHQSS